ncbi:MAG: ABC transporter ATP-binding protein [Gammaproteobacteria bacterium]|nr:ABC transporter ATP-binding protein [Gammaproteobacteria bacterium]NIR98208.1 ABC transporter ATP-binding protein [Gammaproteobacteria bacterium]NIT63879.1 ABC transporter ATP-binding protein [Gammaproteobacteria bacterium]NIV20883.1 ATP-binding cassette domain-containing protein [Gammaproteobacteria bacterium]NIY32459.1 ATP-binding cassette domain-containing protein [Gammaproteobacteria bacterium]
MGEASSDSIVQVRHVTKQVDSPEGVLVILDDVSLDLRRAEKAAIVGASGSGKTTLLGLMAGLDVPSRGSIVLDGRPLERLDEDGRARLRAGRVGFVFQSFHLLAGLTALENVMLPLELAGGEGAREQALAILAQVGLERRVHHYPNQLSGGEQQRVALARAFAGRPRILFADEPTGNLDQHTGAHIIDLLFDLNERHRTTLVLVTHDPALTGRCERRFELVAGRLGQRQ